MDFGGGQDSISREVEDFGSVIQKKGAKILMGL
jgi:hypothetical protein